MCHIAPSKVLENVAEGEEKETDNAEEKSLSKTSVKEEDTTELKVETPELKVTAMLLLLTIKIIAVSSSTVHFLTLKKHPSFRLEN